MSFDEHITSITSSCLSSLSQINRVKHLLDRNTLLNIINALVFSKLVRPSGLVRQRRISTNYRMSKTSQLGFITRLQKFDHITPVLTELKWLSFESMLIYRDCILVFKCLRGLAPDYPANKFKKRSEIHNKDIQNKNKIDIPGYRKATGQRTFHYQAISLWNSLPES